VERQTPGFPVSRGLFVPSENELDVGPTERVKKVKIFFTWYGKDIFNALVFESFHKKV
jgi:hypothetical protein